MPGKGIIRGKKWKKLPVLAEQKTSSEYDVKKTETSIRTPKFLINIVTSHMSSLMTLLVNIYRITIQLKNKLKNGIQSLISTK